MKVCGIVFVSFASTAVGFLLPFQVKAQPHRTVAVHLPSPRSMPAAVSAPTSNDGSLFGRVTYTYNATGNIADAGLNLAFTASGAGVNGPLTAQTGAFFSATKDSWFPGGSAKAGEIDVLSLFGRQGGPSDTSDMAGLLVNVQSTGGSFLASTEMLSTIIDPITANYRYGIDLQDGNLDTLRNNFIGRSYGAQYGEMTTAISIGNTSATPGDSTTPANPGGHWNNFLQGSRDGVRTLTITDMGVITSLGAYNGPGFSTGTDPANGNFLLGGTTGTPYISFNGVSNTRIIGDSPGRLTIADQGLGAIAMFQAASPAKGGNSVFINGTLSLGGAASFGGSITAPSASFGTLNATVFNGSGLSLNGQSNTKISGDGPDRVTISDASFGPIATFQAAPSSKGGNTVAFAGTTQTQGNATVIGTTVTGDLQIAGTDSLGGAWTQVTLTPSSSFGLLRTAAAMVRYKRVGHTVSYNLLAQIDDAGTAGGVFNLSGFPFGHYGYCTLSGREVALTGKALTVNIGPASKTGSVFDFDNSIPLWKGVTISASGVCETL